MVQTLCTSGEHEVLKASVHGTAGVIAGLMAAYNIAACCFRNDRHLRVNSLVYTLLVIYELKHTMHHMKLASSACASTAEMPTAAAA